MRTTHTILLICLGLTAATQLRAVNNISYHDISMVKTDTINWDDMEESESDTIGKTRKNTAKEFNALKYILEHRYRNYGYEFTRRWDDHLFLELGTGMSQDAEKVNGYGLSAFSNVHGAIGKQLNRVHTIRLTAGADFGHLNTAGNNFARLYGKIDWLYNITTYLDGYDPTRLFDLSTIFGIGGRYRFRPQIATEKKLTPEVHVGLQFKFFTGPQAYFSLEPYAGIGSGKVSHRYNNFYGVDLNLIYYIHNNLSPEQRLRYMTKRPDGTEKIVPPSTWRMPWFFEISGGLAMANGGEMKATESLGHKVTGSIGRWLSPVIGLRTNLSATTTTWRHDQTLTFLGAENKEDKVYTMNLHNQNIDWQIESLINPMGFFKKFNWDAPVGMAIVLGGGIGLNVKHQQGTQLKVYASSYTAGLHLWARLADDLQFFIEPRFTHYNYRIPYSNSTWVKRFNDNQTNVNIGFTTLVREKTFRKKETNYTPSRLPLSVGIGGGTNLMHTNQEFDGVGIPYNGNIFMEYHFDKVSSARVCFEYLSLTGIGTQPIHISDGTNTPFAGYKQAMFNYRHNRGIVSIGYMINMSNLLSGYQSNRRFEAEAFVGPAWFLVLNNSEIMQTDNILYSTQSYGYDKPNKGKNSFAMNGGAKLKYNLPCKISFILTPQLYALSRAPQMVGINIKKMRFIETLDLGVQYNF